MLVPEVAMSHQPSSRLRTELSFRREEWGLLVRLPGRLVVATTLTQSDSPHRSMTEGLAGIEAVAAGRSSMSRLVRDVVAAIYDEGDDDRLAGGRVPDAATAVPEVLIACRSASLVLAERAGREDADAYRCWLESIAARVCHSACCGGLFGPTGQLPGAARAHFLAALSQALRSR